MSKESDECYTPIEIIRALGEFDLDPACGPRCPNRTAKRMYRVHGLDLPWKGRVWLNPPYSEAKAWTEKFTAHGNGILLLFWTRDNQWAKALLRKAGAMFVFDRRINFLRPSGKTMHLQYHSILFPIGERNLRAIARSGLPGQLLVAAPSMSSLSSVVKKS